MGRHRRMLPNINSLLLQLHLPSYHQKHDTTTEKATIDAAIAIAIPDSSSLSTTSTTLSSSHSSQEELRHHPLDDADHHKHHHHKRHQTTFSWPLSSLSYRNKSRKRQQHRSSFLAQQRLVEHVDDDDDEKIDDTDKEEQHPVPVPDMVEDYDHDKENNNNIISSTTASCSSLCPSSLNAVDVVDEQPVSNSNHHRVRVAFGNCEIRTYTQVLGDHPCCLEGCPIQLGWDYNEEISIIDVNEYPVVQVIGEGAGAPYYSLRLSPEERKEILFKQLQKNYVRGCAASTTCTTTTATTTPLDDDSNDSSDEQQQQLHPSSSSSSSSMSLPSQQPKSKSVVVLERELFRECHRLNRSGRNSSRKQNRRNQQMFFGTTATDRQQR